MAKKEEPKENVTLRMNRKIMRHAHKLAEESNKPIIWWIETTLAVAWGLESWPKQPKGMKQAKEIKPQ